MDFRDQIFSDTVINLDDNIFTGCTFHRCRVVYRGGAFPRITANKFDTCHFDFQGPALLTLQFMNQLYHGGGKAVVELIIDQIRSVPPPEP